MVALTSPDRPTSSSSSSFSLCSCSCFRRIPLALSLYFSPSLSLAIFLSVSGSLYPTVPRSLGPTSPHPLSLLRGRFKVHLLRYVSFATALVILAYTREKSRTALLHGDLHMY